MADAVIPPPPEGFTLDAGSVPPPPPGFVMDGAPAAKKPYHAGAIAGLLDAVAHLASGAGAGIVGGLAGLGTIATNAMGATNIPPADAVTNVANTLTYQPRTAIGQKLSGAAEYVPEKIAQAGDYMGRGLAEASGSPALGAAANVATQAIPQMLLPSGRAPINRRMVLEQARAEMEAKLNAPRDAALNTAKEQGLTIAPAEANPSLLNRFLEGASGQSKVQQLASEKSQPMAQAIVRKGLGIPEDVPLSIPALEKVRKDAGAAYDNIRGAGRITTGEEFANNLDGITAKYTGAEKDFPLMAKNEIRDAVDSARVDSFDASSGIDAIGIQREKADKAFRAGDNQLGKAHKAVADALEAEIDRGIGAFNPEAVQKFRDARSLIARSYDVQKALKGDKIDARVLAAQLEKGRPLSGGIKDLAEVAQQFPKSMQLNKSTVTPSVFEVAGLLGAGGMGAFSHYVGGGTPTILGAVTAGAMASRPLVRSGVTSKMGQSALANSPDYLPSLGMRLSDAIANDAFTPIVAASIAADTKLSKNELSKHAQAVIDALTRKPDAAIPYDPPNRPEFEVPR